MPKHESWLHTGGTNDTKALKLTVIKYVCAWIMVQFLFHLDYLDVQICEEKPIKGEICYINNKIMPRGERYPEVVTVFSTRTPLKGAPRVTRHHLK
jgi:hypothetical protein